MKKIVVFILTALILVSVVGCTKNDPTPTPTPTPDPTPEIEKTAKEKLIEALTENYQYCTDKTPGSWFIQVDKDGGMMVAIYCAGGPAVGTIGEVTEVETDKYKVRLDVPAFAGSDYDDPYDAYSIEYIITISDSNTILVQFPEGYGGDIKVMKADNGLALPELLTVLESKGQYREESRWFKFTTDYMYTKWMDGTEYYESGAILDCHYLGFDRYQLEVYFQGKEKTEENDAIEPRTVMVSISIYDDYQSMSIDEVMGEEMSWYTVTAEYLYGNN